MAMLVKILKGIALAVLGLILVVLVWGSIEPYTLDVKRYAVAMPDLPPQWEGQTIAVIADMQVGMWLDNQSTVTQAVNKIIDAQPAAALIAGDFVYHSVRVDGDQINQIASRLAPLPAAGIPTYGVLGNHDYSMPRQTDEKRPALAAAVAKAMEGVGVQMLRNEAVPLESRRGGPALYIAGIDSYYADNDEPAATVAAVPDGAPRLVFMHNPASFAGIPAEAAPLALAGHTHGGQVSIPFTPHWSLMSLYLEREPHADGWIEDTYGQPGNRLYVNRGIGMSLLPLRFLTPPELTFFRLDHAQTGTLPPPQTLPENEQQEQ